ncbi:MAG: ABC transporter substrate-binding protein [Pirellulales bacterium]|nr:ABC transporter substrate-binding protein [Pirellulales bacterium]
MARRAVVVCLAVACLCCPAAAGEAPPLQRASSEPFFHARSRQADYAGPGRRTPAPEDVEEVRIGYFGPNDPSHPDGGDMWRAAKLAVDEANQRGGYRGKPYRLVAGWSDNPWGTGVARLTRMVYDDKVWAIVGGIDGPSTHLAEQVVAKARLTLVGPASTDKTVNLANVPWMFSMVPGDHLQAPVLAAAVAARVGKGKFLLVSADDHDPHLFAVELGRCFAERKLVPRYHFEHRRGAADLGELAARVVGADVQAVVAVAGARDSARLVAALREAGFRGTIFGGPAMGRHAFAQAAQAAAEGVVFPLLFDSQAAPRQFVATFQDRFGRSPDYAAAHAYDAVRLLIDAMDKAGLNRARIRDAVRELSPWSGVSAEVKWDSLGGNARAVGLGTIRDGRPASLAESEDASAGLPQDQWGTAMGKEAASGRSPR